MDRWTGKVAIVTGASAGIGAGIVEVLAKAGVQVVALARRFDRLEKLSEELRGAKGKVYPKRCDVAKEDEILGVLEWVETELGGADILVNNAGAFKYSRILDDDTESFRNLINVNVLALAILIKEVVRSIKKRDVPGHIININSITGHVPPPSYFTSSLYTASKFAVTALTDTVRKELATDANKKIKITSISPGGVRTDILRAAGLPSSDEFLKFYPDILDPIDIANAVLYVLGTPEGILISELTIRSVGDTF